MHGGIFPEMPFKSEIVMLESCVRLHREGVM